MAQFREEGSGVGFVLSFRNGFALGAAPAAGSGDRRRRRHAQQLARTGSGTLGCHVGADRIASALNPKKKGQFEGILELAAIVGDDAVQYSARDQLLVL